MLINGINQKLTTDANIEQDIVSPEFAHCIVSLHFGMAMKSLSILQTILHINVVSRL